MLYPVSGIYSNDGCYKYNCHCIQGGKIAQNTVTIPANSVNINIDCLARSDRLEYN